MTVCADLENFQRRVLQASSDCPVLVDFWADWCSPCHTIAPQLQRVIDAAQDRLRLVKIEVDAGENMKLAGHYRLRGFPTVILFVDGEEHGRFSGAHPAHWIQDWICEHLPSHCTN